MTVTTVLNMNVPAKIGPALSATSDMPVIAKEPTAAETKPSETVETKPAETVAAEVKLEGETAETNAASKTATEAKPKQPISERFSEITAQRKASDERANRAQEALNTAIATIERLTGKSETAEEIKKADAQDPRPARPKRDTFDSPDAYDEAVGKHEDALVEWSTRHATRTALAEAEKTRLEDKAKTDKEATDRRNAEETERVTTEFNERLTKFREEAPDFDEVAMQDDLKITEPMAQTIARLENGPEMAYHLGKHPKEAARIAALSHPMQLIEMGKLSATLAAPKQPEVSRAPKPIKPLGSKASAGPKLISEMNMDEYAAQRNAKIAAERAERRGGPAKH